jgi:serine-type D-Ala-D-Ala endopeptidase (penicillin-binding protein 7)
MVRVLFGQALGMRARIARMRACLLVCISVVCTGLMVGPAVAGHSNLGVRQAVHGKQGAKTIKSTGARRTASKPKVDERPTSSWRKRANQGQSMGHHRTKAAKRSGDAKRIAKVGRSNLIVKRSSPGARTTTRLRAIQSNTRRGGHQRLALRPVAHRPSRWAAEPAPDSMSDAGALALRSSAVLVMDQDTNEVLVTKNARAVLPIASLTKLMTSMVVVDSREPMNEILTVSHEDVDVSKGSRSRLAVGATLTRRELLHLALMSSENRAAHTLGRHHPGGLQAFVTAMNAKAKAIGMRQSRFVEPTGLSSDNRASADDLAVLAKAAYKYSSIRELSTSSGLEVAVGERQVHFGNTNRLVSNPTWQIGLQKTGYIAEAGRCLVMQAQFAGRQLIMVFLDSAGKYSRLGDAERVRRWVEKSPNSIGTTRRSAMVSARRI